MNIKSKRMHYPQRAIKIDYICAISGLLFSLFPIILTSALPAVYGILTFTALLFFLFGLRTLIRQNTFFEISEDGISVGGWLHYSIAWSDVQELKISYFSTKRDRTEGWMQLKLCAPNRTLRVDSTLNNFCELVSEAAQKTFRNELELTPGTARNLKALGVQKMNK